jgi:serine/threonine protein kinase
MAAIAVDVPAEAAAWVIPAGELEVPPGAANALGVGGYGFVRRALWRGTPVAAKGHHFLFGEMAELIGPDEVAAVRDAIARELRNLARVRHPHILAFLGATLDARGLPRYLLTEMMDCSLHDLLYGPARVALEQREVVDIALGVARGLAYLHGARGRGRGRGRGAGGGGGGGDRKSGV